jgi:phosphonopyruvate decarboxylase
MIEADAFLDPARDAGYDFYTGVPCSFLTPVINRVITRRDLDYVGAASEGEAVGIAAGAWLAGRKTVVICQNSGLGNTVNPLTSMNWPFRIPTMMIVTWRGQPGLNDEPQHELMGQIVDPILDDIDVRHASFPSKAAQIQPALNLAMEQMATRNLPYAFVMAKGSVADAELIEPPLPVRPMGDLRERGTGGDLPRRFDIMERMLPLVGEDAAIVATTGKCGRELFTLADREQHIYQVGSMGCASAMGLGVAANTERPVIVLDGDGAALMKMGNFATIGAQSPKNLIHILFDNGVHDSTGGQATVSAGVDFARIALACGYSSGATVDDLGGFEASVAECLKAPGPHFIRVRVQPGSIRNLGRPTVSPFDVARRFRDFLAKPAA